jgi:hypothetical protein
MFTGRNKSGGRHGAIKFVFRKIGEEDLLAHVKQELRVLLPHFQGTARITPTYWKSSLKVRGSKSPRTFIVKNATG